MKGTGDMFSSSLTRFGETGYLSTLQLHQKWFRPDRNLKNGDVVLIMDDPPEELAHGRNNSDFPGKDGLVRVARVKTSWTILTRPITKLCFLESTGGKM